jgi:hypothetical protein
MKVDNVFDLAEKIYIFRYISDVKKFGEFYVDTAQHTTRVIRIPITFSSDSLSRMSTYPEEPKSYLNHSVLRVLWTGFIWLRIGNSGGLL